MSEATIVQNGALYFIQHKVPRLRSKTLDFVRRFFAAQFLYRGRSSQWLLKPLPLTTSVNEEASARSRWESEGGNFGELPALAVNNQEDLVIPILVSTEQAIEWGSHLNAEQHTTLLQAQRALSQVALSESNPQRMVNLATRSQLLREAAGAFIEHRDGGLNGEASRET